MALFLGQLHSKGEESLSREDGGKGWGGRGGGVTAATKGNGKHKYLASGVALLQHLASIHIKGHRAEAANPWINLCTPR
jgi:hypothetical protein